MKKKELKLMIGIVLILILLIYLLYKYCKKINNTIHPSIFECSRKYDLEKIYEFDNFVPYDLCDLIVKTAKPLLTRSKVLSSENVNKNRTSTNTFLTYNKLNNIKYIDYKIQNLLGIPIMNYEDLQVVNYKPGQLYKPHYDACKVDDSYCNSSLLNHNNTNRYATFLIYLNDDFTGGETEFPNKNIEVKPKKGKAVLFFNLDDDLNDVRFNSFHGGKPPNTGEKWLCNKWIRLTKYN